MSAAAGHLYLRVCHKLRGLRCCKTENRSDCVHMLQRPLDIILRTSRRHGRRASERGGVSGAGVNSADPDLLHTRQASRQLIGFRLQKRGSLWSQSAARVVAYVILLYP